MRTLRVLCCAVAMAAFVAPAAHADEWNKLTYVTFSQPVELPNVTLPAGTYTIKLADIWSDRNVVQVFSKDRSKMYGTFLAISDKRMEATGKPVVMFTETPAGTPQAVKAFFYPGDLYGKAFVYPNKEAQRIAEANNEPVYSSAQPMSGNTNDTRQEMQGADVTRVHPNGEAEAVNSPAESGATTAAGAASNAGQRAANTAQNAAASTAEAAGRTAQNAAGETSRANRSQATGATGEPAVGTSGTMNGSQPQSAAGTRRQLPQTASSLALVELLSVVALVGAFGVRRFRLALEGRR